MYTNKDDKNIYVMVIAILVVSIVALVAIGNIIWKIISPGVNKAINEVSYIISINRLDYNFPIPAKKEPVSATTTTTDLTPEQQEVLNRNLNYNVKFSGNKQTTVIYGVTNYYEEIYNDSDLGPQRITEDSNKNIVLTIPKLSIYSPVYQTPESSLALKFGFWMHRSSYKLNEGEMVFLCTRRYFDSTDPRSCYYMNYLSVNDQFSIEFQNEKYSYKVNRVDYINDNYSQIYDNISSDKNSLKIVTTGATDTGKGRLVITASRI